MTVSDTLQEFPHLKAKAKATIARKKEDGIVKGKTNTWFD